MKRFLLFVSILLVFSLVSCGQKGNESKDKWFYNSEYHFKLNEKNEITVQEDHQFKDGVLGTDDNMHYVCSICGYDKTENNTTKRTLAEDKKDLDNDGFLTYQQDISLSEITGIEAMLNGVRFDEEISVLYFVDNQTANAYVDLIKDYLEAGYQLSRPEDGYTQIEYFVWKLSQNRLIVASNSYCINTIEYWNDEPLGHSHQYSGKWEYNDEYHYQYAICEHNDVNIVLEHEFDDGLELDLSHTLLTCQICGYQKIDINKERTYAQDEQDLILGWFTLDNKDFRSFETSYASIYGEKDGYFILISYFESEDHMNYFLECYQEYLWDGTYFPLSNIGLDDTYNFVWKASANRIIITDNPDFIEYIEYWNEEPLGHQHTYDEKWQFNENVHFKNTTCEHVGHIEEAHIWLLDHTDDELNDHYICTECDATKVVPHEHTYNKNEWHYEPNQGGDMYHWRESTCGHGKLFEDLHQFKIQYTKLPTEEKEGEVTLVCDVCSHFEHGLTTCKKYDTYQYIDGYYYFGTYPQTLVENKGVILYLNSLVCDDDGNAILDMFDNYDGMYYFDYDVDNNGTYDYRGLLNNNSISWFRYEPIKWFKIGEYEMNPILISDLILDYQIFDNETSQYVNPANNYLDSDIYYWLNNKFLNKAFSQNNLNKIIVNEGKKVILPTMKLLEDYYPEIIQRLASQTAYEAMFTANNSYWTRSVHRTDHNEIIFIDGKANSVSEGISAYDYSYTKKGIRPCIILDTISETLEFTYDALKHEYGVTKLLDTSLEEVIIPSKYNDCLITSIGNRAFYSLNQLKKVNLSDSIISIGENAFYNCKYLTEINFSGALKEIDKNAFSGAGFSELILPDGLEFIGFNSFAACKNLTKIYIPSSVKSIDEYAFYQCYNVVEVTIPFVGNNKTSTYPFGYIFGTKSYQSNNTSIPTSLEKVTILDGCLKLPDYAFYDCANLKEINLPNTLTEIGERCFSNCISISGLSIPKSVIKIGLGSLYNCKSLSKLSLPFVGETKTTYNHLYYLYNTNKNASYYSEKTAISALKEVIILDGCLSLGEKALSDCPNLEKVTLPNTLLTIGDYCFAYCSNLKDVNIPSSVTTIGQRIFRSTAIKDVVVPSTLSTICEGMYQDTKIYEIKDLPNSITVIQNCAFANCENLYYVTLPNGVKTIETWAFLGCYNLETINLPQSLKTLNEEAFRGCRSLNNIYYAGTINNWFSIAKVLGWNTDVPAVVVHCSNGDVHLK